MKPLGNPNYRGPAVVTQQPQQMVPESPYDFDEEPVHVVKKPAKIEKKKNKKQLNKKLKKKEKQKRKKILIQYQLKLRKRLRLPKLKKL